MFIYKLLCSLLCNNIEQTSLAEHYYYVSSTYWMLTIIALCHINLNLVSLLGGNLISYNG